MSEVQLKFKRTNRQRKAWEALADPAIRRVLYGGAKGGGKSHFLCTWLFCFVWTIMVLCDLKPSKNPPHVAWFGRKQATDLTGTTLQTWREVIPEEYYTLHGATEKDPKHILIAGRIAIDYGGLDKQENINKFNSAEYIAIAVDQAEEVSRDDISVLRASLRMVLKDNKGKPVKIPFKELYTANPRQCWLKPEFITNPKPNAKFVAALPTDNPHLPDDYIQTLTEAFEHRPELLKAYLEGDWNAVEGAYQMIKGLWIEQAKMFNSNPPRVKRFITCDPARFGDDECVIHLREDMEIADKIILPWCSGDTLFRELNQLSIDNDDCPIVIEVVGACMGGTVGDLLSAAGREVIEYRPADPSMEKTPSGQKKYYNIRAEAWDKTAKVLCCGVLDKESNTIVTCKNMYDKLKTQLTAVCFKFKKMVLIVEKKEDIKSPKRLGESPDHADNYVMGTWAWDQIDYAQDEDPIGYRRKARKTVAKSPMRMC